MEKEDWEGQAYESTYTNDCWEAVWQQAPTVSLSIFMVSSRCAP